MATLDSFDARATFRAGGQTYEYFRLTALEGAGHPVSRLPFSLRILLENLLRHEDGRSVTTDDVLGLARWDPAADTRGEIEFTPARVLMQDFTGVPALVDLAAMRQAFAALGGDPRRIAPTLPVELVIDHSMQVDVYGAPDALERNRTLDYARNRERYAFLRWGQRALERLRVVPPYTGICHQVNLEYLARVVFSAERKGSRPLAYPDTVIGTDSHTPMVNGLGVLGWGVGGIEAEAALLGQKVSMLVPDVLGVRLDGALREGATATDLVLAVTELLRRRGVVGTFVEFYGPGVANVALADRATIGNMSPEYGATCAIFPVDEETLRYLRFTGRSREQVALVEAYMKEQGLFHTAGAAEPAFSDTLVLDLATVEPSVAGPRRPQDRVPLSRAKASFQESLGALRPAEGLGHGAVVLAAITSCTNTSNPAVMVAAGLLARKAVQRGLQSKPWVKTSLAPGSKVVTQYLDEAGLSEYLDRLGFHNVGYGCGTCIGNSGPLPAPVSEAIARHQLVVCAALSGNRNFEGRVHPEVRANYLMSPPLVVAYALAGRMDWDPYGEPLGTDREGRKIFLRDLWPTQREVARTIESSVKSAMFRRTYAEVFTGDRTWRSLEAPAGDRFAWDPASTYVRHPPYFERLSVRPPEAVPEIVGARVLAFLGDSVTTDHISPAGTIHLHSPAGRYLSEQGVRPEDFNSYGARRGNHEVMVRGTFANVRIRNRLVPGTEGGYTTHLPTGEVLSIYDAAVRYQSEGTPLLVLAGKEYGSGSSRDWAAKGPSLLGVRAVLAESFERIHRSNLVGMGVLPLQFLPGESAGTFGLTGHETFEVAELPEAVARGLSGGRELRIRAGRSDGSMTEFGVLARIDTPQEMLYYLHGGILPYVLRNLLFERDESVPGAVSAGAVVSRLASPPADAVEQGSLESFPASDAPAY